MKLTFVAPNNNNHDVRSKCSPLLDFDILHHNGGAIEPADSSTINNNDNDDYDPVQRELIRVI